MFWYGFLSALGLAVLVVLGALVCIALAWWNVRRRRKRT